PTSLAQDFVFARVLHSSAPLEQLSGELPMPSIAPSHPNLRQSPVQARSLGETPLPVYEDSRRESWRSPSLVVQTDHRESPRCSTRRCFPLSTVLISAEIQSSLWRDSGRAGQTTDEEVEELAPMPREAIQGTSGTLVGTGCDTDSLVHF